MAFTSHGHQIVNSPHEGIQPKQRARCGGPGLCKECSRDAARWLIKNPQKEKNMADPIIKATKAGDFQLKARILATEFVNKHLEKTDDIQITIDDVYVVWASKTLQNWKVLISTTLPDGKYYELTYDGDKKQTYIDCYVKVTNESVPD